MKIRFFFRLVWISCIHDNAGLLKVQSALRHYLDR
jgi:hypothetical protein